MNRVPLIIHRAVKQLFKATSRGDLDGALKWLIIAERQLDMIDRLGAVARDRTFRRFRNHFFAALSEALGTAAADKGKDA